MVAHPMGRSPSAFGAAAVSSATRHGGPPMLPSLLVALALSAPVPKAPPIDLSWRFTTGDVFYVTHELRTEGCSSLNGGKAAVDPPERSFSTLIYRLTVGAADAERTVLAVKYLSCEYKKQVGDGDVQKDTGPDVEGKEFTITLDAARQITKVKLNNKAEKTERENRERGVRQELTTLLRAVPGKPLAAGGMWAAEYADKRDPGYEHERAEQGNVGETAGGLTALSTVIDHTTVVKLGDAELGRLRDERGQRTVQFEAGCGRVRMVEEKLCLGGVIDYGGGDKAHITLKFTTTITVTDEKPKAKK